MRRDIAAALERVSEQLPAMIIETLREQWARVAELDKEIGVIERRIKLWHRSNAASRQIAEIPGVGVLSATAVVAAMGDPAAFRSGREFAAWLGRVPRHSGTGGRVRMLGISHRGEQVPPHPADPRCLRGAHQQQGVDDVGFTNGRDRVLSLGPFPSPSLQAPLPLQSAGQDDIDGERVRASCEGALRRCRVRAASAPRRHCLAVGTAPDAVVVQGVADGAGIGAAFPDSQALKPDSPVIVP